MSPRPGDTSLYGLFEAPLAGGAPPAPAAGAPGDGRKPRVGAAVQEWRTPPLWGLVDSGPYLHDGRAETIDDAIRLHGGQASASAQRYAQLSARERRQLEAFLLALAAPGPEP
jgi:cytochrome c peroxidase